MLPELYKLLEWEFIIVKLEIMNFLSNILTIP